MSGVLPQLRIARYKKFLTALYLALTGWMGTFLGFCGVVILSVKSHRPHKPM
jgi:hypothetical protein